MKDKKNHVEQARDYKIVCIGSESECHDNNEHLKETYNVRSTQTLDECLKIIDEDSVDLVIENLSPDVISAIKSNDPSVDVLHIFDEKNPDAILDAAKIGVSGYLVNPYEDKELLATLEIIRRNKKVHDCHATCSMDEFTKNQNTNKFIGESFSFRNVLIQASKLKGYSANVLINGESGTGKEVLARYIHGLENDPKRPFVALNCAAIPEQLIESELFGHEKGSFTGATQRKLGKFEMADRGDIFLDEVSTLKPDLQAKLLRVLEEKEVCRIGNNAPVKLKFRVISASNDNLEQMIKKGTFRLDLYHRLKVVELKMPPLRERLDDIPLLIKHFMQKYNRPDHMKIIKEEALDLLKLYSWPGNIRELENLIQNLIIVAPNGSIEASDIPSYIICSTTGESTDRSAYKKHLDSLKRSQIKAVLEQTNGNKTEAAKLLGVSRSTLHDILREDN